MPTRTLPEQVAAVDLGSNSFHMVVARPVHGRLDVLDRLREPVRLAAGLDEEGVLEVEAGARALDCLSRFGQRLRGMPPGSVRAVGTNTLRRSRNARSFLVEASRALGHPIEIISGAEEARLVYLGVASDLHPASGRRLVVDIGGGSTEVVLGEGHETVEVASLYMGCVSFSRNWFPEGKISPKAFARAVLAARVELEPLELPYRSLGWEQAVGSSGTILAIESILAAQGWTKAGIDLAGLRCLRDALTAERRVDKLSLAGLTEARAPVLPGGLAILIAVFEALGLESMATSQGALREGLLHDLLGRFGEDDARDHAVEGFARRYHVDLAQAARVEGTAAACLAQAREDWGLTGVLSPKLLAWAARLHEMGLTVAHAGYHKHGAYLLGHSEMPGFSREDQGALAALVRFHRGKLDAEALPRPSTLLKGKATLRLCALLRLAVLLNRSRAAEPLPAFRLRVQKSAMKLIFPRGWLEERPLTRADLMLESERLGAAGLELTWR